MKYIVEFYTGSEWKRWNGFYTSEHDAWNDIVGRVIHAPHIQRRVTPVSE
jgi:hypothetical protein